MASSGYFITFEPGQMILEQDKTSNYLYILMSGIVKKVVKVRKSEIDVSKIQQNLLKLFHRLDEVFSLEMASER